MLEGRQEFFLKKFTLAGRGLEIGPSHFPIATKKDCYNVQIEDHARNIRHTSAKVFDFYINKAQRGGKEAWSNIDAGKLKLTNSAELSVKQYKKAQKSKEYIDIHNWLFTPESFRLLIADLQTLGLTKLSYADELPTQGFEFFSVLSPKSSPIMTPRKNLVNDI